MDTASQQESAKEFRLLLDEARRQLQDAQTHFDIWVELWPTEQNVKVINAYRGFFIPARKAHLDEFFIKVSNVVSNDHRAPSLYRLLDMVDRMPSLAPGLNLPSLRDRLKKQKGLLRRIKRYRNKRAAHWDTDLSKPTEPVQLGESKEMLKELQDMFNEISSAHTGGQVWVFTILEHRDTYRLLDRLRQTHL